MAAQEVQNALTFNEKIFWSVSYIIVSLMMGMAAITLTQFGNWLVPTWNPVYLPFVCVFISMERLYSYRYVKGLSFLSQEWLIFQISQWVVMGLLLKAIILLTAGLNSMIAKFYLLRDNFIFNFFDDEYLIVLIIAVSVWFICGIWADHINEIRYRENFLSRKAYSELYPDKSEPRQGLINAIFTLGLFMTILNVFMRLDLRTILGDQLGESVTQTPGFSASGGVVLFYFFLGFALIAQSKFADMYARWSLSNISVDKDVAWKWSFYSLVFLFSIAILISLLPTGYSLNFLPAIGYVLGTILKIFVYIFSYFAFLVIFIFSLLAMLFGRTMGDVASPSFPDLSRDPVTTSAVTVPWFETIKTILFWIIFLAVIIYSFSHYLYQHEAIIRWMKNIFGWRIIIRLWEWLKRQILGLNRGVTVVLDAGIQRFRAFSSTLDEESLRQYLSLRKLTPKQKIYFYFLSMIRRGRERGNPRRNSHTPYEYAAFLERIYPDVDKDITSLTENFVEARYSQHDVEDVEANRVKGYWQRIRKAFRKKKKS